MYQDAISERKTMGDVDVVHHAGVYHLFHLVLPNHDYVAHATSEDGLNWRRVRNALFIGHPGSWDDHMLWTMHVSRGPWEPGRWRMFYTGLARSDGGNIQRIGCANSTDLMHWEKAADRWRDVSVRSDQPLCGAVDGPYDPHSAFPLEAHPPDYESSQDEGRSWVSFRDPFYFHDGGPGRLLMAARTARGPVIRRGCVGQFVETAPNQFSPEAPLHHPGLYDDIEVPNLVLLEGRYYLIGSIREDAKVRYWYADTIAGPWANFFDNVLLPAGNYAARVSFDDHGPLVWNFFTSELDRTVRNLMPPPKRLRVCDDGRLGVATFEGFDDLVQSSHELRDLLPVARTSNNSYADLSADEPAGQLTLSSQAGFEGFLFSQPVGCFRFRAEIHLHGLGKCGLLFRTDPHSTSGYHVSLDLLKGVAQIRAWGERPGGHRENAFAFKSLQAGYWQNRGEGPWAIGLIGLRNYIEFSIDGHVLLTLSDDTYSSGRLGVYVESACVRLEDVLLEHLEAPTMPTDHLPAGRQTHERQVSHINEQIE